MKQFIKDISLFTLILLFIGFCGLTFIQSGLKKSRIGEYSTWNDLEQGKINADLVVYGSSRAWRHFNTKILEDSLNKVAYNFGIDGFNFDMQYQRHLWLLKHNPKPKTIIYSLDIFTLFKREDLFNIEQFIPYLSDDDLNNRLAQYKGFDYFDLHIPFIAYYGRTKVFLTGLNSWLRPTHNLDDKYHGFSGNKQNLKINKGKLKEIKYQVSIYQEEKQNFISFLNECRKNQIKVIFAYSPEYYQGWDVIQGRDKVIALFDSISYAMNIPFFNYAYDSLCFDSTLFYNVEHLNEKGANRFTNRFCSDLKRAKLL